MEDAHRREPVRRALGRLGFAPNGQLHPDERRRLAAVLAKAEAVPLGPDPRLPPHHARRQRHRLHPARPSPRRRRAGRPRRRTASCSSPAVPSTRARPAAARWRSSRRHERSGHGQDRRGTLRLRAAAGADRAGRHRHAARLPRAGRLRRRRSATTCRGCRRSCRHPAPARRLPRPGMHGDPHPGVPRARPLGLPAGQAPARQSEIADRRSGADGPHPLSGGSPGRRSCLRCALDGEAVVEKPGKGAFYATELGAHVGRRGIAHLVFAGVTTEVCVQTHDARGQRPRLHVPARRGRGPGDFPESRPRRWPWSGPRARIVGWTATAGQVLAGSGGWHEPTCPGRPHRRAAGATSPSRPFRARRHRCTGWSTATAPATRPPCCRYAPGRLACRCIDHAGLGARPGPRGHPRATNTAATRPAPSSLNPAGSRHSVRSPDGCVALLVWERPIRLLA